MKQLGDFLVGTKQRLDRLDRATGAPIGGTIATTPDVWELTGSIDIATDTYVTFAGLPPTMWTVGVHGLLADHGGLFVATLGWNFTGDPGFDPGTGSLFLLQGQFPGPITGPRGCVTAAAIDINQITELVASVDADPAAVGVADIWIRLYQLRADDPARHLL